MRIKARIIYESKPITRFIDMDLEQNVGSPTSWYGSFLRPDRQFSLRSMMGFGQLELKNGQRHQMSLQTMNPHTGVIEFSLYHVRQPIVGEGR